MDVAADLHAEALETGERRLLVLAGQPSATRDRVRNVFASLDTDFDVDGTSYVGPVDPPGCESIGYERSDELLGATLSALVIDCHERCEPNLLGRLVGTVDGGGLLVLLTPPLDDWPERRDEFDETLATPPADVAAVAGNFRRRLVRTLREHPGVAIVDVDSGTVERDGLTHPAPRLPASEMALPEAHIFPEAAFAACRTQDQADALLALEGLASPGEAVVVESDRGRGKSSVAGLAAASLAHDGSTVLVTAPQFRNVRELFARARELRDTLTGDGFTATDGDDDPRELEFPTGSIRYRKPADAAELPDSPDRVIVDEAAALPVRMLESFLDAASVAFVTTVHGYEGTGRGFSVRFREHLAESAFDVTTVRLSEPIRYAAGDPVEVWSFRALALDARPPVAQLVADATPESVEYRELSPEDLLADENLLRETFGLLVLAHYRTEPNDLARMLDAPNITVHALLEDGHPVSVALLAKEGGLSEELRQRMYTGSRVRGNLVPDLLCSQLRDPDAGATVGHRVMRIATHSDARSRGLGSLLLSLLRERCDRDWLGVGYGATPGLVEFWRANGFRTVHVATSRNDRSGEHSIIMLDPLSETGHDLLERHTDWFCRRFPDTCADALSDVDPDVIRAACRATAAPPDLDLPTFEKRIATGIPIGGAILETAPRPIEQLAFQHLIRGASEDISAREERLLVRKVFQCASWETVAAELEYPGTASCKRALGDAVATLVRSYGDTEMVEELERFESG